MNWGALRLPPGHNPIARELVGRTTLIHYPQVLECSKSTPTPPGQHHAQSMLRLCVFKTHPLPPFNLRELKSPLEIVAETG